MKIEISLGDLIDKITILKIKTDVQEPGVDVRLLVDLLDRHPAAVRHALLERLVVADALVDHLIHGPVLPVIVDGHLHPVLPLRVPDRRHPGDEHEGRVLHVRVVEQGERDGQDALAFEVVHVLEVHRGRGLVVEPVHRPHAALERVEDEFGHGAGSSGGDDGAMLRFRQSPCQ